MDLKICGYLHIYKSNNLRVSILVRDDWKQKETA